jgi:hypothetical protein
MKTYSHSTNTAFEYHLTRITRANYDLNLNHQVLPDFMKPHKDKCPNTTRKIDQNIDISENQRRALDKTIKGFRNRLHGHFDISEHFEPQPTKHIKMSEGSDLYSTEYRNSRTIILHHVVESFTVLKEETGTGSLEETEFYLNRPTRANYAEWPGLKEIHDKNEYRKYLVATLHKNTEDRRSSELFDYFIDHLRDNPSKLKILPCTQAAGSDNLIYMVVYKDEPGFGACICRAELGLFRFSHSMLYKRQNKLEEIKESLRVITHEAQKVAIIQSELERTKSRLSDLEEEKRNQEMAFINQYEHSKKEFQSRELEMKKCIQDMQLQFKKYKDEQYSLTREFNSKIQQLQSELLSSRNKSQTEIEIYKERYQSEQQRVQSLERRLQDTKTKEYKKEQGIRREIEAECKDNIQQIKMKFEADMKEKENEIRRDYEERIKNIEAEMMEKDMCIICKQNKKNTAFIPCGHLVNCNVCIQNCDIPINKKLRKVNINLSCDKCSRKVDKVVEAYAY